MNYIFFIYLLTDIQNLVFYYFNNAMMNVGGQQGFVIPILVIFDACSNLRYLVHMVELVLVLWVCHLFPQWLVSFHVAISSIQRFNFLTPSSCLS